MKSYTDREQSKKLEKILPLESADMTYCAITDGMREKMIIKDCWEVNVGLDTAIKENLFSYKYGYMIPCWSLAALLDVLPNDWWGYNKHYFLEISKMGDMSAPYIVSYFRFREQYDGANFGRITHISFQSDNPVDACYEMILKLHELKLL